MKLTYNSTPYEIPTSWTEVKWIDFANSKTEGLPLEKKLSYQTRIPSDVILNLRSRELASLLSVIEFQDKLPEFFDEFHSEMDVGNEHYIKLEQARQELSKGNQWIAAIEITKLYTGTDISDMPVTKAMGYAAFFLTRLQGSLKDTQHLESTRSMKMRWLPELIDLIPSGTSQPL